ncbi:MAG: hypothetical protein WC758_02870 [Candidatus Woesearchaeota archaeon]
MDDKNDSKKGTDELNIILTQVPEACRDEVTVNYVREMIKEGISRESIAKEYVMQAAEIMSYWWADRGLDSLVDANYISIDEAISLTNKNKQFETAAYFAGKKGNLEQQIDLLIKESNPSAGIKHEVNLKIATSIYLDKKQHEKLIDFAIKESLNDECSHQLTNDAINSILNNVVKEDALELESTINLFESYARRIDEKQNERLSFFHSRHWKNTMNETKQKLISSAEYLYLDIVLAIGDEAKSAKWFEKYFNYITKNGHANAGDYQMLAKKGLTNYANKLCKQAIDYSLEKGNLDYAKYYASKLDGFEKEIEYIQYLKKLTGRT